MFDLLPLHRLVRVASFFHRPRGATVDPFVAPLLRVNYGVRRTSVRSVARPVPRAEAGAARRLQRMSADQRSANCNRRDAVALATQQAARLPARSRAASTAAKSWAATHRRRDSRYSSSRRQRASSCLASASSSLIRSTQFGQARKLEYPKSLMIISWPSK